MKTKNRKSRPDPLADKIEVAYCYATGLIEFGSVRPKGGLEIAAGPRIILREVVTVLARHSYPDDEGVEQLLVPGVPERISQTAAVDAVIVFSDRVRSRMIDHGFDEEQEPIRRIAFRIFRTLCWSEYLNRVRQPGFVDAVIYRREMLQFISAQLHSAAAPAAVF